MDADDSEDPITGVHEAVPSVGRYHYRVTRLGFEGLVTEIDMRYTTLQADDRRILIPNSTIMTSPMSVFKK